MAKIIKEYQLINTMNKSSLVSVIIPNYCHARYLDERIQSVLNQTYSNFELIILDDCSPDNGASKSVIEKYRSNSHVSHILYNQANSGSTFIQWNKGFSLAKGEYIWIAESDDSCDDKLLESLVALLDKNPEASVAFCKSVAFNEGGLWMPIGYQGEENFVINGDRFIHDGMRSGTGILNASSAILRKDKLLKIKELYRNFKGSGDRMFWIEMAEQGEVAYASEGLNKFRLHKKNSTKKFGDTGTNQREDKVILDYLLQKSYITSKEYKICKRNYVRAHIFEMVTDKKLKKELYDIWNVGMWTRFLFKLEAWKKNTICKISKKHNN